MSYKYIPRRASGRWLDEDCPSDVLCLLDAGKRQFDRWTVVYRHVYDFRGQASIFCRGMSDHPTHPQGFGISFELSPYEVAKLRYRQRSARWSDLPEGVRACIWRDCEPGGLGSNVTTQQAAAMGVQSRLPGIA